MQQNFKAVYGWAQVKEVFPDSIPSTRQRFITYTTKDGLPHNYIYSLLSDDIYCAAFGKDLWFGTYKNGLLKLDTDFTTYTTKDGLLSNQIWDLAEFKDKLYIVTFEG